MKTLGLVIFVIAIAYMLVGCKGLDRIESGPKEINGQIYTASADCKSMTPCGLQ